MGLAKVTAHSGAWCCSVGRERCGNGSCEREIERGVPYEGGGPDGEEQQRVMLLRENKSLMGSVNNVNSACAAGPVSGGDDITAKSRKQSGPS